MRVSRAQAEENRETVINVASNLFREHGFDGIGLKDLMKGAGLTQGGFYKQFASKDDLAAQASRRAMESATRRWSAAAGSANPSRPLSGSTSPRTIVEKDQTAALWWRWALTRRGKVKRSGAPLRTGFGLTSRSWMS